MSNVKQKQRATLERPVSVAEQAIACREPSYGHPEEGRLRIRHQRQSDDGGLSSDSHHSIDGRYACLGRSSPQHSESFDERGRRSRRGAKKQIKDQKGGEVPNSLQDCLERKFSKKVSSSCRDLILITIASGAIAAMAARRYESGGDNERRTTSARGAAAVSGAVVGAVVLSAAENYYHVHAEDKVLRKSKGEK